MNAIYVRTLTKRRMLPRSPTAPILGNVYIRTAWENSTRTFIQNGEIRNERTLCTYHWSATNSMNMEHNRERASKADLELLRDWRREAILFHPMTPYVHCYTAQKDASLSVATHRNADRRQNSTENKLACPSHQSAAFLVAFESINYVSSE